MSERTTTRLIDGWIDGWMKGIAADRRPQPPPPARQRQRAGRATHDTLGESRRGPCHAGPRSVDSIHQKNTGQVTVQETIQATARASRSITPITTKRAGE